MQLPKAILIDLDDTILDDGGCTESCWTDACADAATRHGFEAERLKSAIKAYASEWWGDDDRHRRGRLDLRAATTEIVTEALTRLSYDAAAAVVIANHYRDLREARAVPFVGAIETLAWLRERGVKLGMMTNGAGPAQRAKIERPVRHRDLRQQLIDQPALMVAQRPPQPAPVEFAPPPSVRQARLLSCGTRSVRSHENPPSFSGARPKWP